VPLLGAVVPAMKTWEMANHKDFWWYVICAIGWVTEKSRTYFANVTDS